MKKQLSLLTLLLYGLISFSQENVIQIEIPKEETIALDSNEIFIIVDEPATYPEGTQAMMAFIRENITYPESAREKKLQGRVFVQFVINKNGSISAIKVVKGVCAALNNEAINVIKKMPNWIPGKNNGEAVRSIARLPISFKL